MEPWSSLTNSCSALVQVAQCEEIVPQQANNQQVFLLCIISFPFRYSQATASIILRQCLAFIIGQYKPAECFYLRSILYELNEHTTRGDGISLDQRQLQVVSGAKFQRNGRRITFDGVEGVKELSIASSDHMQDHMFNRLFAYIVGMSALPDRSCLSSFPMPVCWLVNRDI